VGFLLFLVPLIALQYLIHLCRSFLLPVHPPYYRKGVLPGKSYFTKRP
jgi:hypothetical protein